MVSRNKATCMWTFREIYMDIIFADNNTILFALFQMLMNFYDKSIRADNVAVKRSNIINL